MGYARDHGKMLFGMSECYEWSRQRHMGKTGRVLNKFGKSFG